MYIEHIEQFVFDANANFFHRTILTQSLVSSHKTLRPDKIPSENYHEWDHMGKQTCILNDLLWSWENTFFGLNKKKPGKRCKNVIVVGIVIDRFEFKFVQDFLELIRELD